ncbi:MAG TPA: hypothetical protein PLF92_08815, partial [Arenimonas sp.]|nr:hypothetical protein [Arenimonas sp.]HPW32997.1 hypothetical protein [Arenimonas sp.]
SKKSAARGELRCSAGYKPKWAAMRWIMLANDTFSRSMSCNQINGLSLVSGIGSCAFAVPIL